VQKNHLTPFLKWPGGKRWFVQRHSALLPTHYNRYVEPFLGGGAVYFHLQPTSALLGDINPDVVEAYQGIKRDWQRIQRSLEYKQRAHDTHDDYYYKQRDRRPNDPLLRASRTIYLNRTCFNGIYRVNLRGEFNVPRGTKNEVLMHTDNFERVAELLQGAEIQLADFEVLIDQSKQGDLVFADPPYTVRHNLNGFVKYNEVLFSWQDQERLATALGRAKDRGAKIICTNANHESVQSLYEELGFQLRPVSRFSSISAASASRRQFEELVITANCDDLCGESR
jgi:DNA adenine methylase